MKKLLFILTLLLTLTGCTAPAEPTLATIPTPPSIPHEQTPSQILSAALDRTLSAPSFTVEYRVNGQPVATQSVIAGEACEPAAELIRNPNFLADFCAMGLRAIPSNTGTIRYEVTGLTADDLSALLGIEIAAGEDCSVALETNEKGYLTRFEYQAGPSSGSITVSQIGSAD